MGTSDLMDYTAIGDTVNTASRLEGMCSKYGVGAVISRATAERCGDKFVLKQLDLVRVKGRSEGIPIFTVLRPEEAERSEKELSLWNEAFALYVEGNFQTAGRICRSLFGEHPNEKLYKIFAERADTMAYEAPKNWDGVFTYENK
jgi:adenylate cyclase